MPYTLENAEEFEQAYLQLAHLYVERGKFDLSQASNCVYVLHQSCYSSSAVCWRRRAFYILCVTSGASSCDCLSSE